jgi:hypothetical protein
VISPVFQVWDEVGATPLSVIQGTAGWAVSDVFCDVGSLTLTVDPGVVGVSDLMTDEDRQVRVLMAGAPDQWFLLDDDSWAGVSDAPASEPRTCALRSLAGLLDEVYLEADQAFDDNAGAILAALFADAQARGYLQGMTLTGDGTADAGGGPWVDTISVTYKAGSSSLLAILKGLSDALLIEWRMHARALEVYAPGGALDRTPDIFLRPGADVAAAPGVRSRMTVATDALVVGSDGTVTTATQTLAGRRKRQALVQQSSGSATDPGTQAALYLAAHAASDVQLSHDLQSGDDNPTPWADYRPGDRLPTVAAGDGVQAWRIAQLSASGDASGIKVSAELGSLLLDATERMQIKVNRLAPGAIVIT